MTSTSSGADPRSVMLARIRDALSGSSPADVEVPRDYRRHGDLPEDEVLALFAERVDDYRAQVHRVGAEDLAGTLASVLAAAGARRVLVPDGLDRDWLATLEGQDVEVVADDAELTSLHLDGFDAVITAAAVAVAETGTIVLDAGPDQGRRAITLVPDHHVCVVRAEQVVQTVPEAIAGIDPRRPLTWISGPSATSDIELDRVEGVHGPRVLDVIVVGS